MSTKQKQQENIAAFFGEGDTRTVVGRKICVRFLSINDSIEVQQRIGGIQNFDGNDFLHVRFLLWLIFRKGDSNLTREQIENEEYAFTEKEVGRTLTEKMLNDKEVADLIDFVLIGSGWKQSPEEVALDADEAPSGPNVPAAEAKPQRSASAA